jgi:hypothetical protein
MLPKRVYSKVVQRLKSMNEAWLLDRAEHPRQTPYEIDVEFRNFVERTLRDEKVYYRSNIERDYAINELFSYLVKTGKIVKSSYGGHMFSLPKDHDPLPGPEEMRKQTVEKMNSLLEKFGL